jgi:hypothetical protein
MLHLFKPKETVFFVLNLFNERYQNSFFVLATVSKKLFCISVLCKVWFVRDLNEHS